MSTDCSQVFDSFQTDFTFYVPTQGDAIKFLPLESRSSYSFPQGGASL